MARIKKGDLVAVVSGKDRGKTGKVLQVLAATDRAIVERINLVKHFERRSQQNQAGGIIEREGSVALSKLILWCPRCKRGTRIGWARAADGSKQRVCRRCHEVMS